MLAVLRPVVEVMGRLERIAEATPSPTLRRDATATGFIDLAMRHRNVAAIVNTDPAVHALVKAHPDVEAL